MRWAVRGYKQANNMAKAKKDLIRWLIATLFFFVIKSHCSSGKNTIPTNAPHISQCQHRPKSVSNPSHFLCGKDGGILREKILSEQFRNAQQQLRVNTVTVENAVAGAAVDVQPLRQPRHRAALRA